MTAPAINDAFDMPLPKEVQQQDTMRGMTFTDQHGRKWSTVVSMKTLDPCAAMTPIGWRAPLPMMVPPQKYMTFRADEIGRVWIDYDRWITDLSMAEREYGVWVMQVAKQQFGAAALQKIEAKDHGLRVLCGPPPQSSEIVKAMKSNESQWVLGIPHTDGTPRRRPAWADAYVEGWVFESTFDGGDVDVSVQAGAYRDDDEDAAAIADRLASASQYADDEDDADPDAAPDFQPIKRGRGRPRKES